MENILRSFGAVIDDVNANDRTIVAKISAGDVDRYRTMIDSHGVRLENYRKNPIVLFEHGKSPIRGTVPIGRNVWIKQDGVGNGRILAKTRFAEDDFSDLLFSFYKDGTMRGWSISLLPEDVSAPTRDEIRNRPELRNCEAIYRSGDLLEYSVVSKPGLASALSDPELRSLSTLVVRGFWTPDDDVKPLVEPIVERMCESGGMADGGALVGDDGEPKKKAKKRSADDESDDEEEEDEAADRSMADDEPSEIEAAAEPDAPADPPADVVRRDAEAAAATTPEPEPEPADPFAGLPPLVARSLGEIMADHSRMIRDWQEQSRAMIREFADILHGKV